MAEKSKEATGKSSEMAVAFNFPFETDRFPRNLLREFMSVSAENSIGISRNEKFRRGGDSTNGDCDGEDEIELNLNLSLGGRFGVDKTPGKLKRSSSVVGTMPILRKKEESEMSGAAGAQPLNSTHYSGGLTRTASLPAEMEEEWRKRKEIQTLRRMEVKKRRFGKQKSCRISSSGNSDTHTAPFGLECSVVGAEAESKAGFIWRPRSVDSDGGGGKGGGEGSSSSLSELDSKNQQGSSNSCGEEHSPRFITRCSSHHETEKTCILVTKPNETEKPAMRKCSSVDGRGKGSTAMLTMPCVFTKGEGPNGRTVEGILYKYGKGEEVRIMCICHGSFLSPAEFVKHAGGTDVDHPLRHIVVNTSSSFSSLFL